MVGGGKKASLTKANIIGSPHEHVKSFSGQQNVTERHKCTRQGWHLKQGSTLRETHLSIFNEMKAPCINGSFGEDKGLSILSVN